MYNYGICHVCGGQMKAGVIKQDFWVRGKLIVIDEIPAGVCTQCGEKIVKADVGVKIAALIESKKKIRKARTIVVPVIRYQKITA
jgi:YgiT-type zinc finger domain-containing protein